MEYIISEIIDNPDECPIMHEYGYLVYRIHKVGSEWNRDNYIGDTNELLKERMFNHKWGHLNFDAPWATKKLRNAILKYGTNNFTLEIIYKGDYIDWLEEYYITMHDSYEHGYNQNRSGKGTGGMTSELAREISKNYTPEQLSERSRKSIETMGPEGLSARAKKTSATQLANGTHPFQNLTHDQCVDKSKKAMETMGPEGLSVKSRKAMATMGPEGLSARSRKAMATMGQEGLLAKAKKATISRAIDYVFYNPSTNEYRIHVANWNSRFKHGFTKRLCKLLDWEDYKSTHNLDVELIH